MNTGSGKRRVLAGVLAAVVMVLLIRAVASVMHNRRVNSELPRLSSASATDRREAAAALGDLKDARAVEPLIRTLGDPDPSIRRNTAEALGKIRDPRAVNALMTELRDTDASVSKAARESLVQIGLPSVDPLIAALKDPDPVIRMSAAMALGDINVERAIEPLSQLFEDPDSRVRAIAGIAVGEIRLAH